MAGGATYQRCVSTNAVSSSGTRSRSRPGCRSAWGHSWSPCSRGPSTETDPRWRSRPRWRCPRRPAAPFLESSGRANEGGDDGGDRGGDAVWHTDLERSQVVGEATSMDDQSQGRHGDEQPAGEGDEVDELVDLSGGRHQHHQGVLETENAAVSTYPRSLWSKLDTFWPFSQGQDKTCAQILYYSLDWRLLQFHN